MKFEINHSVKGNTVKYTIPIPKDYPETPLVQKLRDREYYPNVFAIVCITLGVVDTDTMYINSFHVFPSDPEYNQILLPTEKGMLKGCGKVLLCKAVQHALVINSKLKTAVLEASGGHCYDTTPVASLYTCKYLLNLFEKEYPSLYEFATDNGYTKSKKLMNEIYCMALNNQKLVKYYKREYGFKVVDDSDPFAVYMEANVQGIINRCGV